MPSVVYNNMECVAVELKLSEGKHVITGFIYLELRDQMWTYLVTPKDCCNIGKNAKQSIFL